MRRGAKPGRLRTKEAKPYRPRQDVKIGQIERRRKRLGVSCEELAGRAGLSLRTLMRIRASNRAWLRHVRHLAFALRAIEQEQRRESDADQTR